jgi:hypothetical protein
MVMTNDLNGKITTRRKQKVHELLLEVVNDESDLQHEL